MKRFFIVSVMLACIFSVIGGHFYYNNKLEQTASAAKLEMAKVTAEIPATAQVKNENQTNSNEHFKNAPKGIAEECP